MKKALIFIILTIVFILTIVLMDCNIANENCDDITWVLLFTTPGLLMPMP